MFVEMHSHVVYGVDDGAQSYDVMMGLLTQAANDGVSHIICTPHIAPGMKPFPFDTFYQHLDEGKKWCAVHAP